MRFLHWATLEPQGPSKLAAIRFSSPIKVQCIRVFPPGEQLFDADETIVSATEYPKDFEEPRAVVEISLFFTAAPSSTEVGKPKPTNQLASTVIYYDGGVRDFKIDMGEYTTRVMVLMTWIPKVTIAVYGELASEQSIDSQRTASTENLSVDATDTLPAYLDVARAEDPSSLATTLLQECISSTITTSHLLRLMFLLKPSDSDWDLPGYPEKYAEIAELPPVYLDSDDSFVNPKQQWLETIMETLRFPIYDGVEDGAVEELSSRLVEALADPDDIKPAWLVHLICSLAKQPPRVADIIMGQINLHRIIDYDLSGDMSLLDKLIFCAANPCFANHLRHPDIVNLLQSWQASSDDRVKGEITALLARVEGWVAFSESLTQEDVSFAPSVSWLYDLLGDEDSFATFIQGAVIYEPIASLLKQSTRGGSVLPLFSHCPEDVSLEDRRMFVRAIIGLGLILPVFCWANSEGKHLVLSRFINAGLLWQQTPGYQEIFNRMLSLKQCIWRLSMTVKDFSQGTSLSAEQLLYKLYRSDPRIIFQAAFGQYIAARGDSTLPPSDEVWYGKASAIGRDGLGGALRLILYEEGFLNSMRDPSAVYLLYVCIQEVRNNVERDAGENLLRTLWELSNTSHGIIASLVEHLTSISSVIQDETLLIIPNSSFKEVITNLYKTTASILYLLNHFYPTFPQVGRVTRDMIAAVIRIRVSCHLHLQQNVLPPNGFEKLSDNVLSNIDTLLTAISNDKFGPKTGSQALEILLLCAETPFSTAPVLELEQIAASLKTILPVPVVDEKMEELTGMWTRRVLDQMPLLLHFLQRQTAKNRSAWILRLADMDQGFTGLGEYILEEEVTQIQVGLQGYNASETASPIFRMLGLRITNSFSCIREAITERSDWTSAVLFTEPVASKLYSCYAQLSILDIHDQSAVFIAKLMSNSTRSDLKIAGISAILREGRLSVDLIDPSVLETLKSCESPFQGDAELISNEIGAFISTLTRRATLEAQEAELSIGLLEWLSHQLPNHPMTNLSIGSFKTLQLLATNTIGETVKDRLEVLNGKLKLSEDDFIGKGPSVLWDSDQTITLDDIKETFDSFSGPRTPPKSHPALGLVSISPHTSLSVSPMANTLTKTYLNNDFRQLRTSPSARQNSSRPPSTHVDDFRLGSPQLGSTASIHSSPTLNPKSFSVSPSLSIKQIPFQPFPPPN